LAARVGRVGRGPISVLGRHTRQHTGKGQVEQLSLLIPCVALVAIGLFATGSATDFCAVNDNWRILRVTGEL